MSSLRIVDRLSVEDRGVAGPRQIVPIWRMFGVGAESELGPDPLSGAAAAALLIAVGGGFDAQAIGPDITSQ